ncbi:MAG: gephyrin-like molybdotransferase Glp [Halofilum sp. (in: g-proteobacteria)]|nr:gephyrin-like molybdotransferase Glp [Halofilum sp. (in: g-proteobacteria)]
MSSPSEPGPAAGCDDAHGSPAALGVAEAHARIAAAIEPVREVETLRLRAALGRVLADDIVSELHIPPATNAAMDGFAFRGADLDGEGRAELALIGTAWAGHPLDRAVGAGECARIMTGAPVPDGADSVVMQERTETEGERVRIRGARAGDNIRQAGEDIAPGDLALPAGTRVRPAELGVLASLGLTEVRVYRRPRVALFATGDELYEPGQPLQAGGLYDSNRYAVWGMLTRLGMAIDDRGHLPDERGAVEASLAAAAAENDAVITTGGVSVGAADHVAVVLREQGDIGFWQLTMKPGRPLNFGYLGGAVFFGLPGNPVSAMVTFYQFVQPALRALGGAPYRPAPTLRARTAAAFPRKPGRTEYQRAVLTQDEAGTPVVERTGDQGSGRLSSMSRANCFVVIPAERGDVEPGEWVDVQLFEGVV